MASRPSSDKVNAVAAPRKGARGFTLSRNAHNEKTVDDDADALQSRLNQVNSFHASFTQRVTGAEGGAVQEGEGELWVKRPNLFNWHMTAPDESVLVSDGVGSGHTSVYSSFLLFSILSYSTQALLVRPV